MISYIHSWWFGTPTSSPEDTEPDTPHTPSLDDSLPEPSEPLPNALPVASPVSVSIWTPEESQEVIDHAQDEVDHAQDDTPPAFPSLNSIQRSATSGDERQQKSRRAKVPAKSDEELMPPPLPPTVITPSGNTTSIATVSNPNSTHSSLSIPSSSNVFRIPSVPSTSSNTLQLPLTTTRAPKAPSKRRDKVVLAPRHSPLDWAALKASGQDLRGTTALMRITPSQLKKHNKRNDAWAAFNGKVYNITPYLPFHPGGEKELMRVAGRDGTKLFALTHAWVNVDFMLDECMVGFIVPEPSSAA